jgi:hypothetical protein
MGERHVFRGGRCKGCGCTPTSSTAGARCPLPADTVRHMVGGETGSDAPCHWTERYEIAPGGRLTQGSDYPINQGQWCPATTPEAP